MDNDKGSLLQAHVSMEDNRESINTEIHDLTVAQQCSAANIEKNLIVELIQNN